MPVFGSKAPKKVVDTAYTGLALSFNGFSFVNHPHQYVENTWKENNLDLLISPQNMIIWYN